MKMELADRASRLVAAGRPAALPVEGQVSLHLAGGMGVAAQAAPRKDRLDLVAERRGRVPCPGVPGAAGNEEQGEGDSRAERRKSSHVFSPPRAD